MIKLNRIRYEMLKLKRRGKVVKSKQKMIGVVKSKKDRIREVRSNGRG
jgi:hypothetical protein